MTEIASFPDARLPVTLLTGFLGSGKTTLVSKLLGRASGGRLAVIVNEFGDLPIDGSLIGPSEGPVVALTRGCLCCQLSGDLVAALLDLHARRASVAFDQVIIETSGLADPGPILAALTQQPKLSPLFRIEGVAAMVDGSHGLAQLDRQRIAVRQAALADRIVITKSDISPPSMIAQLGERLRKINPFASVIVADHGAVDDDWVLAPLGGAIPWTGVEPEDHDHADHHHHGVRSFSYVLAPSIERRAFLAALAAIGEAFADQALRIKGLVALEGADAPTAIHIVQGFLHPPIDLPAWPDADRRSRLTLITDEVEEAEVRPYLAAFLEGTAVLAA